MAMEIVLTNIKTNEKTTFKSKKAASEFLGRNPGFVDALLRRGKNAYKDYTFKVVKGQTLKDLTVEDYKRFKTMRVSDEAIVGWYNTNQKSMQDWKKENGLANFRLPRVYESKLEKNKKRFIELYNKHWSHEAIAKEMGLASGALSEFKKRYFPDLYKEIDYFFTKEQMAAIKKAGINYDTIKGRMKRKGMTFEQALAKGNRVYQIQFTKEQREQIKKTDLHRDTVRYRMLSGMSFEDAISKPNQSGRKLK